VNTESMPCSKRFNSEGLIDGPCRDGSRPFFSPLPFAPFLPLPFFAELYPGRGDDSPEEGRGDAGGGAALLFPLLPRRPPLAPLPLGLLMTGGTGGGATLVTVASTDARLALLPLRDALSPVLTHDLRTESRAPCAPCRSEEPVLV
jgi:hypothetical protein